MKERDTLLPFKPLSRNGLSPFCLYALGRAVIWLRLAVGRQRNVNFILGAATDSIFFAMGSILKVL